MDELSPRQLLERLVAFPTVSTTSNLDLIEWLSAYLSGHGLTPHLQWNDDRTKAGLFAHAGPMVPGAVVLSGHSDVVPVEGQVWTSDPWTLTERDGRLYGRGTCDMKGFDALAIWALVRGHRQGLTRPMQLALSYDEELGCTGAPPLIHAMAEVLPKGRDVIVGEPSMLGVITGHKGGVGYNVHVRGHEVHSSLLPEGVSAVMEAAGLIHWISQRNQAIMATPPGPLASMFHPPFSTLHVGMVQGGTANNITAADCRFAVEMRMVPGEDIDFHASAFRAEAARLDASLRARRPGARVDLAPFFGVPPLRPEGQGTAETLALALTGSNATGTVSYGTEAGHFQDSGYSAVVCGPGDIAQAHQADEFLTLAQLDAGQGVMQRLLSACA